MDLSRLVCNVIACTFWLVLLAPIQMQAQSCPPGSSGPTDWFDSIPVSNTSCPDIVPAYFIDLRCDPNQRWYSNLLRRGPQDTLCCGNTAASVGINNLQCIEFKILLHPGAEAILLEIPRPNTGDPYWDDDMDWYDTNIGGSRPTSPGAKPNVNVYEIRTADGTCLGIIPDDQAAEPQCLTSDMLDDTIYISWCQTGNNPNLYRITSIKAEISPDVEVLAEGCGSDLRIEASDIDVSTVVWSSVPPNPVYDSYLSSTTGDTAVTIVVPKNAVLPDPPILVYEVCADPINAETCDGLPQVCAEVQVLVLSPPDVVVNAPTVCPEDPYVASIQDPATDVTYTWFDGPDGTGSDLGWGNSKTFASIGDKSVVVEDPFITLQGYAECAFDTLNFTLSTHPTPLAEINGPTDICVDVAYNFTATNDGVGYRYIWDFGLNATPATWDRTGNQGRNPPSITYSTCGNKVITLIVESSEGCRDTTTYNLTGDNTVPVLCSLDPDSEECGGTADNNAAIIAWHNANLARLNAANDCTSDNCPWTVTSDFDLGNFNNGPCGSGSNTGSITVIYTVSDGCNSETTSATFTIVDDIPPTIDDPDLNDMTVECVLEIPDPDTNFTYVEICGSVSRTHLGDGPSGPPCNFTIVRRYEIVDACGNSTIHDQTFTVNDLTPPTITCPDAVTINGCNESVLDTASSVGGFEYSGIPLDVDTTIFRNLGGDFGDNCGIALFTYVDVQAGYCPIVITRTFYVEDSCGNSATCQQTIEIFDFDLPEITCPTAQTIEGCDVTALAGSTILGNLEYSTVPRDVDPTDFNALTGANVSDNCNIAELYYVDATASTCPIQVTRTFTVVDDCGNMATCTQTILIDDTTSPDVSDPSNEILEACGVYDLVDIAAVGNLAYSEDTVDITIADLTNVGITATDECGIARIMYVDEQSGQCPVIVTRVFVVVDLCGNRTEVDQDITLDDTTPPDITCRPDVAIEDCGIYSLVDRADLGNLAYSEDSVLITMAQLNAAGVTTSDECGLERILYIDSQTGSCPIIVTREFIVYDTCQNRSTCSYTISIDDTQAPTLTCTPSIYIEGCGIISLEASLLVGNLEFSEAIRSITAVELNGAGGTASDFCGIDSLYYFDQVNGSCPTIVTRTFVAVDSCENRTTCVSVITIDDTTDPLLQAPPQILIEGCDESILATTAALGNLEYSEVIREITDIQDFIDAGGAASDDCFLDSLYYYDVQANRCPIQITRTYVAVDSCGNRVQGQQLIEVWDQTLPTISCVAGPTIIEGCDLSALDTSSAVGSLPFSTSPADITIAQLQGTGADASDVCGIERIYYFDSQSGACPIEIIRTYVVIDSCNNQISCEQVIHIDDTTPPSVSEPADVTLEACGVYNLVDRDEVGRLGYSEDTVDINVDDLANNGITAHDVCGISRVIYVDTHVGSCPFVVTRVFQVTDLCGNITEVDQEITIDDTTPPVIICRGDAVIVDCGVYSLADRADLGNLAYSEIPVIITIDQLNAAGVNASDECELDSIYYIDTQAGSCPIIVTRTFYVTDSCENQSTCFYNIEIDDPNAPTLACNPTVYIEGCGLVALDTSLVVGNLPYSSSISFITLVQLEAAGGTASDDCGIDSLYYFDEVGGRCPTIVTRTFVAVDSCDNRTECISEITIDDTTDPILEAPDPILIEGCDESILAITAGVNNLEYSEVIRMIDDVQDFVNAGGVISENCHLDSLYYTDVQANSCPLEVTRTFVAVDSCGNRVEATQEIQVWDQSAPTISCNAGPTIIEGCSVDALDTSAVTGTLAYSETEQDISLADLQGAGANASDPCGIQRIYYFDSQSGSCPIEVLRTFVVLDSCNNEARCEQVIHIDDTTPPTVDEPTDENLIDCGVYNLADRDEVGRLGYSEDTVDITVTDLQNINVSASDVCGIARVTYIDRQEESCPVIVTRLFTITDLCGNITERDQIITVGDTTSPILTCPNGPVQLELCGVYDLESAAEVGNLPFSEQPVVITVDQLVDAGGFAEDDCGLDSLYYYDNQTGSCPIIVTRTFVATDTCHNISVCSYEIHIDDTEQPDISCASFVDVEGCGVSDLATNSDVGLLEFSTAMRTITVDELIAAGGAASDNCGIDSLYYYDEASGSCPTIVTRTFVVVDSCNNQNVCISTIEIHDRVDPELTAPEDILLEGCDESILASSGALSNLEYSETIREITDVGDFEDAGGTVSDNCHLDSLYYFDTQTGFCPIEITRTFVAIDSCSNRAQVTQIIRVLDTTLPSLTCPPDVEFDGCNIGALVNEPSVLNLEFSHDVRLITIDELIAIGGNAGDACGIDSIYYRDTEGENCPITVTRTFYVVDLCGNRVSCDQLITIDNTSEPTIICPDNILINACSTDDLLEETTLEFSSIERFMSKEEFDALDPLSLADDPCGVERVGYVDEIVSENCPLVIDRTFTVYDSCGLLSSCVQRITMEPLPLIDPVCPAPVTTQRCIVQQEVDQLFEAWISGFEYTGDGCFLTITPLGSINAPPFCGGEVVVEFVVEDVCGNQTSCTSSFTVPAAEELEIVCPADIRVSCPSDIPTPYGTPDQFEAAGGQFNNTCRIISNSFGLIAETSDENTCPEVITRVYEVTDICGYVKTCVQTITVHDEEAPVLEGVPADITVACDDVPPAPIVGVELTARDNCDDLIPAFEEEIIPGECENTYTIERSWYVEDVCGNSDFATQTIIVTDCRPNVEISLTPNPVCLGGDVTFDADIQNNYTDPVYRWQVLWNNTWVDMPGGTTVPYILENVDLDNEGTYRLLIADKLQSLDDFDCNVVSETEDLVIITPRRTHLEESICDGEVFIVGDSRYTTTGSYEDTLLAASGCDSIVTLDLTVLQNSEGNLDTTICAGDRLIIAGSSFGRDGQYVVHLTNSVGCDSALTIRLRVHNPEFVPIADTICEGESVTIANETYDAEGTYTQVLADRFGCDSTLEISIVVIPTERTTLDHTICVGDFYRVGNSTFNLPGTYEIVLQSAITGCDSIVTLNLQVLEEINVILDRTICEGDSSMMAGKYYSEAGTYKDTLVSRAGCDSIITLNLAVVSDFTTDLDIVLCEGESVTVGPNTYTQTGQYSDLLVSSSGCDSLVNLNLVVYPHRDTSISASICAGESVQVGGQTFNTTGVHTVTIPTLNGCDSTIVLDLVVYQAYDTTYNIELCEGESFSLAGETYTESGTYQQAYTTVIGCDSVITIEVQVFDRYEETRNITLCTGQQYQVGNSVYDTSGFYSDTLASIDGCDSIIHLELSVVEDINVELSEQICEGNSYRLGPDTYTESGTYQHTFTSSAGCDSTVTLHLSVLKILRDTSVVELCEGTSHDFDGTVIGVAGTYEKSYTSTAGCDSIHTLILSFIGVQRTNLIEEICEGDAIVVGGSSYFENGTYVDTLMSAAGCDSIVTLNLRVNEVVRTDINQSACEGETIQFAGSTLDSSGIYVDSLQTYAGCDSIVTLTFTVFPTYHQDVSAQICEGQVYFFNGTPYAESGVYEAFMSTGEGCDSTVVLTLEVVDVLRTTLFDTICAGDSVEFFGRTLKESGTYSENLLSSAGCDSIVSLALVVHEIQHTDISEQICEGEVYRHGAQELTTTGQYVETFTSVAGCDSIVTLDLIVFPVYTDTIVGQICEGESYDFNGQTLTDSGTYSDVLQTVNGCDSGVVLLLEVIPMIEVIVDKQICAGETFTFDGEVLTETATRTGTFQAESGCDSIVTLNLEVVDAIHTDVTLSTCVGSTVMHNGHSYEIGTHTDTLVSSGGCDSILYITVEEVAEKTERLTVEICEGETYEFNNEIYTTSTSVTDTFVSSVGCDSIVTFILTVHAVYEETIEVSLCTGGSYTFDGQVYDEAGLYEVAYQTTAGCDSIVRLEITIQDEITTEIHIQNCNGGTYDFNGRTITEPGVYRDTLLSQQGCDSILVLTYEELDVIESFYTYNICPGDSVLIGDMYYKDAIVFEEMALSSGGCDSIAHHEVVMLSEVTLMGEQFMICEDESVELHVIVDGTLSGPLNWTPADGLSCTDCLNPIASPSETTTYKVSTEGCLGTKIETEVVVEVLPLPTLEVMSTQSPNGGQEVILSATTIDPAHIISWFDPDGQLICRDCDEILQVVTATSTYVATAANDLSCEVSKELTVQLAGEKCDYGLIEAANIMTPNGDGSNDYFQIRNSGDSQITLVQIFNRWGEIIFESKGGDDRWDGTIRGVPANPAVFIYTIHGVCTNNETFVLSGNVTLVR